MSVSIMWRVAKPIKGESAPGTSTDWAIFQDVFARRTLSQDDIPKLRAMHAVSRLDETLWGCLADALDSLPEGTRDRGLGGVVAPQPRRPTTLAQPSNTDKAKITPEPRLSRKRYCDQSITPLPRLQRPTPGLANRARTAAFCSAR